MVLVTQLLYYKLFILLVAVVTELVSHVLILDMVKNKGLIPSAPGQIFVQRKQLKAIIDSLLPACTEPDIKSGEPFTAEAIIANPPAYGEHVVPTSISCI